MLNTLPRDAVFRLHKERHGRVASRCYNRPSQSNIPLSGRAAVTQARGGKDYGARLTCTWIWKFEPKAECCAGVTVSGGETETRKEAKRRVGIKHSHLKSPQPHCEKVQINCRKKFLYHVSSSSTRLGFSDSNKNWCAFSGKMEYNSCF